MFSEGSDPANPPNQTFELKKYTYGCMFQAHERAKWYVAVNIVAKADVCMYLFQRRLVPALCMTLNRPPAANHCSPHHCHLASTRTISSSAQVSQGLLSKTAENIIVNLWGLFSREMLLLAAILFFMVVVCSLVRWWFPSMVERLSMTLFNRLSSKSITL